MGFSALAATKNRRQADFDVITCMHSEDNFCVLALAVESADPLLVRDILRALETSPTRTTCINRALQSASALGCVRLSEILVGYGGDLHFIGGPYQSCIEAAIVGGRVEMVEWLIDHGLAVDIGDSRRCPPLALASIWNREEVVMKLLNHGANVNQEVDMHGTALQAAALQGYGQIVAILLEYGADANMQGGYYGNALQAAAATGCSDIIALLLEGGANVTARGGYYGSALEAALSGHHGEAVSCLLQHGAMEGAEEWVTVPP